MPEMLELEGCHISLATLSHLTDKGTKSQGHMMIFILVLFPISKKSPLWGLLRSHNLWHSFLINLNYKYLHLEAKGISLQNLFHSGSHCDLKIFEDNLRNRVFQPACLLVRGAMDQRN